MAAYSHFSDNYFETQSNRSPTTSRQPHLHRQTSRPFDAYGTMPLANAAGLYNPEDNLGQSRFESSRSNFNAPIQNSHMNGGHFPYDLAASQSWNPALSNVQPLAGHASGLMPSMGAFGGTGRLKPSRGRGVLPNPWYEQNQSIMQSFSGLDGPRLGGMQPRNDSISGEEDELIPTAIVIKNIPFAVKKEQLVQLMTDLGLPLPYAFNYHFDNGVFRGLAFANFTSAEETAAVIQVLNHFELQGRKLRVEYKKMLPLQERERIEREKRERRGQLEEQHRPMPNSQLHGQGSMSSLASHLRGASPSPVAQRPSRPEFDLNDQQTLDFYNELLLFRSDMSREVLIFPATLEPGHRRTVHTIAHVLGLAHVSRGNGDQRQVHIYRAAPGTNVSPPNSSMGNNFQGNENLRRGLSRAATTDFSEARQADTAHFNTLRGQSSVGLLGVDSSTAFSNSVRDLRAAKSFAELRSWTPSPVPSSASFPTALQTNGARFQQLDGAASSGTPTLTPTASNSGPGVNRDDTFLVNGLSGLSLGSGLPSSSSPRRQRNAFSSWEESQPYTATAPIGSNRTVSLNVDHGSQDRLPSRQPRGPALERGPGFRRQNGRGSDELRGNPPIIVE